MKTGEDMAEPFMSMVDVTKRFPGVTALADVNLELHRGEVMGLVGENGAGKSTLIKILSGVYRQDEGEILVEGRERIFKSPQEALASGISCIYQELNIVPQLTVVDNIFLGREKKRKSRLLNYAEMKVKAAEILEGIGQKIDPMTRTETLGVGQQQMIEIARSLTNDSKIIIMDEPTSSLGEKEIQELFKTVLKLKSQNVGILFVSHKLEELFDICDRVTVMRDGRRIATEPIESLDADKIIRLMVGREVVQRFPKKEIEPGAEVFRAENLTKKGIFRNISFSLRKGEILGFSGLVGSRRTELMNCLFGADQLTSGEIFFKGGKTKFANPRDAMNSGFAFLTEDRKMQGLVLQNTIAFNLVLTCFKKLVRRFFLDRKKIDRYARDNVRDLNIKTKNLDSPVNQLSGGNQQKVIIGKWLNTKAEIYIFDEPTRGIDVGAKVEVYKIMGDILERGGSIIMVSSELPEILGMSDRVVVMRRGEIMRIIDRQSQDFTEEKIMEAAWGKTYGKNSR